MQFFIPLDFDHRNCSVRINLFCWGNNYNSIARYAIRGCTEWGAYEPVWLLFFFLIFIFIILFVRWLSVLLHKMAWPVKNDCDLVLLSFAWLQRWLHTLFVKRPSSNRHAIIHAYITHWTSKWLKWLVLRSLNQLNECFSPKWTAPIISLTIIFFSRCFFIVVVIVVFFCRFNFFSFWNVKKANKKQNRRIAIIVC